MEDSNVSLLTPGEQSYALGQLGLGDRQLGRDVLMALSRRLHFARAMHSAFGGLQSVLDEAAELKEASDIKDVSGRASIRAARMREEIFDVMATCVRLLNGE